MSQSPTSDADIVSGEAYRTGWTKINELIRTGGSWSGHERNCCFLNTGAVRFADVSAVSGLDFLDDGRAVASVDWDLDGDLDLWIVNRTSPRLRFLRNDVSRNRHFLLLKLTGQTSNRDAIGARVELTLKNRKLIKTVHAGDGYLSQSSKRVHFGLGNDTSIEQLVVRWPGGAVEQFQGVEIDTSFELVEGRGRAERCQPRGRTPDLKPSQLKSTRSNSSKRVVMLDRIPLPSLSYQDFNGNSVSLGDFTQGPVLVNLWSTTCVPCLAELQEFVEQEEQIRAHGLKVIALSVDGLQGDDSSSLSDAEKFMVNLKFPFHVGAANPELLDKLEVFQDLLISLRAEPGLIPSSFLIDDAGRMAVIYLGPVRVSRLLSDVELLDGTPEAMRQAAFPFPGRWFARPYSTSELLVQFGKEFIERDEFGDAIRFATLAADLSSRDAVSDDLKVDLAEVFYKAGHAKFRLKKLDDSLRYFKEAVRLQPDWAQASSNLGSVYYELKDSDNALKHFSTAISINPNLLQAQFNLGLIYLARGENTEAIRHFQAVVGINRDLAQAHNLLGVALARDGKRRQSVAHLNEAIRLSPNDTDVRANLNAVLSGRIP